MEGILLDRPICYRHASMRYFKEGEHHIDRLCKEEVLLLVFEGVLRFKEDGVAYELYPGDYHIQRKNSDQAGPLPSGAPKYLYVHFTADWGRGEKTLPRSGHFDYSVLRERMERLDYLSHHGAPYITQCGCFYDLLGHLFKKCSKDPRTEEMAAYIAGKIHERITLEELCRQFHFSKNHIINLFKKDYGVTPIIYANQIRLEQAEYRMEVTSDSLEEIALSCGFSDYSHFYKLFIKKHRLSPEKWRKSCRLR